MKKVLISIMMTTLLLCFTACMSAPDESLEPEVETSTLLTEEIPTPPPTPPLEPRTAEEVLPAVEVDIFPEKREGIYASSFSVGADGMMAILADGSLVCRGWPSGAQPEDPENSGFRKVMYVQDNYFDYVYCEQFGTFAIDADDTLWGWGSISSWGNILGTRPDIGAPLRLLTDVQTACSHSGTYMAMRKDGTVWMWGEGTMGEFGMGPDYEIYSMFFPLTDPVKVFENAIYAIYCGGYSYAIKEDNSLWVWGGMKYITETGETLSIDRPVRIMEDVKYADGRLILKTDGTLWEMDCDWPDMFDDEGNPMVSDIKVHLVMEDVKLARRTMYLSLDNSRFFAIKNDGSLWVWKSEESSALLGSEYTDTPIKIMDDVVQAMAGEFSLYALKSDGTLWEIGIPYETFKEGDNPSDEEIVDSIRFEKILDGVLVK